MRAGNKENRAKAPSVLRDSGNDPGDPGPIKKLKLTLKKTNDSES